MRLDARARRAVLESFVPVCVCKRWEKQTQVCDERMECVPVCARASEGAFSLWEAFGSRSTMAVNSVTLFPSNNNSRFCDLVPV